METEEKVARLTAFREALREWDRKSDVKTREYLNQNVRAVRRIVVDVGCLRTVTISPPPAVGGLLLRDADPFAMMFDAPYGRSMTNILCDMLDAAIGAVQEAPEQTTPARIETGVRAGYMFVAMAINDEDHALVDVLEAIKAAAKECGLVAERIDDDNRNERITDRILESIRLAEYVAVDLTNERPNVFYEAGYAHALGKTPIYVARQGTKIHFDVKDYPIIFFKNMKQLRESLVKRLRSIAEKKN